MNIIKTAALAVATIDELTRVVVSDYTEMGLTVKNTGANPVDAFEIYFTTSASGPELPLALLAADYTSPSWPIRESGDLTALAAGASLALFMNIAGIYQLIFKGSSGTGVSTVELHAQLS
jgi:hypothetical protein